MTQATTSEGCPDCGKPISEITGFPVWCDGCEWGLPQQPVEHETRRRASFEARLERKSSELVAGLYDEVARSAAHRPGWDAARVASYALALLVHALTVLLVLTAAWLIAAVATTASVVEGILVALAAWAIAPRLGSLRKVPYLRRRGDAPVLFGLLDRVAAALEAKPVHAVVLTGDYNAAYGTVGVLRRRVLYLGLPLWDTLPAQQKIALLGHELAHGVNGDSRHGVIVGAALTTLHRLRDILLPGDPERTGFGYIIHLIARLVQSLLSSAVGSLLWLQTMLTLRAGQRAEYLADDLAGRIASPSATADMLDSLLVGMDTYRYTAGQIVFRSSEAGAYWIDLRDALAGLPDSERERRRRVAARQRLRVDRSHPPTHLRIAVLRGRPPAVPTISLPAGEEAQIRTELAEDYTRVARHLRDNARARLYRG